MLWLAPEGVIGTLGRYRPPHRSGRSAKDSDFDLAAFFATGVARPQLVVRGIGISFGGIKAASDVSFTAQPGAVTSLIGPNGAGKTTVLNMIGGFYRPDAGSIRIGDKELAGAPAWRIARAGIARTYQTTQLFGAMSVLDNILVALRRGKLGNPLARALPPLRPGAPPKLCLSFVGYHGPLAALAGDLPHVDRRLVEIARALATRPQVLLLDEPAAGLMRSDKAALGKLIRRIADLGIAVILVEHDMALVMGISDHIVVLDAGRSSLPARRRGPPRSTRAQGLSRWRRDAGPAARAPWTGSQDPILSCLKLTAGYGAAPVLKRFRSR